MKRCFAAVMLVSWTLLSGCGGDATTQSDADSASAPAPPAPTPPGKPATADEDEVVIDGTIEEPVADEPAAPEAEMEAPAGTTEEAQVGVGAKGRDYGGPGLVTTPVETYFRTGERIAFEIQIPSAMKLYKAAHDNKGPKTQEEFMNVIIKENGIQLPELPEGDEFVYNPKTEQLLVRHPPRPE